MENFNISQIEMLKKFLYSSYVHDAKIENIRYDRDKKILKIEIANTIYGYKYIFTFERVNLVLSISGNGFYGDETILSLTVEEDYSYIKNCKNVCGDKLFNSLYLLFQMFSGDELHIASEKVFIERYEILGN